MDGSLDRAHSIIPHSKKKPGSICNCNSKKFISSFVRAREGEIGCGPEHILNPVILSVRIVWD